MTVGSTRRLLVVLLLALLPGILSAHPRTEGAHPRTEIGQFAIETDGTLGLPRVSLLDDERPIPLWSPVSIDSSAVYVRIGNTVESLSDGSPSVRGEVIEDDTSFTVRWRVQEVEIDLSFVSHEDYAEGDFALRMQISNQGPRSRSVGVRYLIDTWFGEHSETHFETGSGHVVTAERNFTPDDAAVISKGPDGVFALRLDRGTQPSKVAVANRQRLSDAGWTYSTGRERGFSLPPFSVQDSALHVVYDRTELQPGDTHTIETWFSAGIDEVRVAREEREEAVDDPDRPSAREPEVVSPVTPSPVIPTEEPEDADPEVTDSTEIARELRNALEQLREISDGQRRAEPGELEELRETIERLRRERDRL